MEEGRPPEDRAEASPEEQEILGRIYLPHEVQARLEVSASGLRRLAGIYERTVGPLSRDERGRVWPEEAVEALEDARLLVRESRATSIEAALRGQEVGGVELHPATQRPSFASDDIGPGAAILEELRALRAVIEEQNARIADLEEAVRTGRELEAPEEPAGAAKAIEDHSTTVERAPSEPDTGQGLPETRDPGLWRRVLAWFGFGGPRPR